MTLRIAHLQPIVPHYREEFFALIGSRTEQDIYVYSDDRAARRDGFSVAQVRHKHIHTLRFLHDNVLIYNPFTLLRGHDVLVLMLHVGHVTTWLLLFTKWLHRRKIILWGQGISIRRYHKEERRPNLLRRWMISLADGCWIYVPKQAEQWRAIFPRKPIVALYNTVSNARAMAYYEVRAEKERLRKKYGIKQHRVMIICTRFESKRRRTDILEMVMRALDPETHAFIIIGGGSLKPDFSVYANAYDFGSIYDNAIKRELFAVADIYFQPGWIGLSVVEAMAYALPVFTFVRDLPRGIGHGVEYDYINNGVTGRLFTDIGECVACIRDSSDVEIKTMGDNARRFVRETLMPEQMAERAYSIIEQVQRK